MNEDEVHIPVPRYCMCQGCRATRHARAERNGSVVVALLVGGIMLAIGWTVVENIAEAFGW